MLQVIGLVLRWFPAIIAIVQGIEAAFDPEASGEDKKKAALAALAKFFASVGVTLSDAMLDTFSKVIDAVVAVLNVLGVFRRKGEATPETRASAIVPAAAAADAAAAAVANANDPALDAFLAKTKR